MDFESYRQKIFELLINKAKNNLAREAIIELKELDVSIKATNDLTVLFQEWLNECEIIEKTTYLGKGRILCIVRKFYEGDFNDV